MRLIIGKCIYIVRWFQYDLKLNSIDIIKENIQDNHKDFIDLDQGYK